MVPDPSCEVHASRGLVGLDGGAARSEFLRFLARVGEGRAGVGVDQVARLDALEAVMLEPGGVLCFQQSACDSTGPEVDVAAALLADGLLDRHVCELDAPARLEHAVELGEDGVLVRDQVDHAV